jgi:hypothetical protein
VKQAGNKPKGKTKDNFPQLSHYIDKMVADNRLQPVHISLSLALFHSWTADQLRSPFKVTRKILMKSSHIRSKATYHKAIKELQLFGYLRYCPSYHPINASQAEILVNGEPLNWDDHG